MAAEPTPRWWGEFDAGRRSEHDAEEAKRDEQGRQYREALFADVIRDGEAYAKLLHSHFIHASQLSSEDVAAMRAGALALGTQFAAIESALRFAEALQ